jgi:hypothetical protein
MAAATKIDRAVEAQPKPAWLDRVTSWEGDPVITWTPGTSLTGG